MWIPKEKCLPLLNKDVLVADGLRIDIGFLIVEAHGEKVLKSYSIAARDITHWQNLPDLP
jgi:hypothetical protein